MRQELVFPFFLLSYRSRRRRSTLEVDSTGVLFFLTLLVPALEYYPVLPLGPQGKHVGVGGQIRFEKPNRLNRSGWGVLYGTRVLEYRAQAGWGRQATALYFALHIIIAPQIQQSSSQEKVSPHSTRVEGKFMIPVLVLVCLFFLMLVPTTY